MIKKVRATLFKEIIVDVECEQSKLEPEVWWPIDEDHLKDLLRDNGDEFNLDYDVIGD